MTTPTTTLGRKPGSDATVPPVSSVAATVSPSLRARFCAVRGASEGLVEGLAPEDFVVQSMDDVSPTKWHLAHTSWFWEAFLLRERLPGYEPFHPRYHYLFNSYYVQAGERHCRAQRGYLSRPTVAEVMEYRRHVDAAMDRLLESTKDGTRDDELTALVELGLNHEQQHQELILTDLKHVFSVNPLRPAYREGTLPSEDPVDVPPTPAESIRWVPFEGGLERIGWAGEGFHFDNEAPRHRRFLEPFLIADRLSTNREYLAFMEDGGYQRAELWMSEGWARRAIEGWTEPFYWEWQGDEWWCHTLSGMRRLDLDEPVCHVNWFEADAFARWSGSRLPREDEWEVAAGMVPVRGNLLESGRFHPDRAPAQNGERPVLRQIFGDVWEWTSSPYSPYAGYKPLEGVVGEYNGKFMCGQFVLRGGSCATPATHIRRTYRNFFPPDASWQFSGIRLARDPG
jgi:ergothioneine biosynthesis protein EgtB